MRELPTVLIYRNRLLQPSETFIKVQTEALQNFLVYYAGLRSTPALKLPDEKTYIVNQGGLLGRFNELCTTLKGFDTNFVRKIKKLNPAFIHSHFGQDGVMAMPLANALQVPLLVTFHGFDITVKDENADHSLLQKRYFRRREQLKQDTQLFIAVSQFIQKRLLEQGFSADKTIVHYIGVDTEFFQPNAAIRREPIVLFVGRLVEKKGCEYLIRAMQQVQNLLPEVKLVIIGDGPLRCSLEELAQKSLRNYQFLGVQPPERVRSWMQRSKVFCVPSITAQSGDSEGLGMVFVEAQATGLPIVSSHSGGISEAVTHEQTGFLLPEKDIPGLASQMLNLLQNQDLWHRFSETGQQHVRTHFNLRKQTRLLEDIYTETIKQKNQTLVQHFI